MEDLIEEDEDKVNPFESKYPDASKHQNISFWKSAIRITTCVGVCVYGFLTSEYTIAIFALGFCIAEILGLYEELV